MDKLNITIPDGWHEVPIRTFQELSSLDNFSGVHKVIELIAILSDTDPDEIKKISSEDFEKICEVIKWTSAVPGSDYKTDVTIGDVPYFLVPLKSLSLGEWIDLDSWCEDSITNLHKIFALLYRPVGEAYDVDSMNKRAELFLDKLMIEDVYGTLLFFLTIGNQYLNLIKDYTTQPPTKS